MRPVRLRWSWRTWLRLVLTGAITFVVALLAFTDSLVWWGRLVAGALTVGGLGVLVDAVLFARTWDVDGRRWWLPSLLGRWRVVPVDDDRVMELVRGLRTKMRIVGPNGGRDLGVNPVVSGTDLERWFDEVAAEPGVVTE